MKTYKEIVEVAEVNKSPEFWVNEYIHVNQVFKKHLIGISAERNQPEVRNALNAKLEELFPDSRYSPAEQLSTDDLAQLKGATSKLILMPDVTFDDQS